MAHALQRRPQQQSTPQVDPAQLDNEQVQGQDPQSQALAMQGGGGNSAALELVHDAEQGEEESSGVGQEEGGGQGTEDPNGDNAPEAVIEGEIPAEDVQEEETEQSSEVEEEAEVSEDEGESQEEVPEDSEAPAEGEAAAAMDEASEESPDETASGPEGVQNAPAPGGPPRRPEQLPVFPERRRRLHRLPLWCLLGHDPRAALRGQQRRHGGALGPR